MVLCSRNKYENLSKIRIRYLNYSKWNDTLKISLSYPEDLVSATLMNVKIANISECTSLKNLSSESNAYIKEDIS